MNKTMLIALATIFLLIGSENIKSSEIKIKNEGLPSLDRSSDIKGHDKNQNGIRDDIEEYIIKNYPDEKQRKAMFQFAKAVQASLLVDTSNMITVKEINRRDSLALNCIFSTFDEEKGTENSGTAWRKIVSMSTNTKERLKAYLAFSKALDGTSWSLPEGDTCE